MPKKIKVLYRIMNVRCVPQHGIEIFINDFDIEFPKPFRKPTSIYNGLDHMAPILGI